MTETLPPLDRHAGKSHNHRRMGQDFQVAGKYQAISLVGRGGMGAVYDAVHRTTGRRVALKLLREHQLAQPRAVERFLREARIVGGISSPHVAGALDAGTDEESGIPYLAMEFLEGVDLKVLLGRRGRLPWGLALVIGLQVCRGLAAAHAAGIIHRDVKPANVRLTAGPDGELVTKVLDFGVAKDVAEEMSLTITGDVVGSFSHMAPEQFSPGSLVDFRADLWAVGMLLFESIAGKLPVTGPMSLGLMIAGSSSAKSAPDIRTLRPDVPPAVAELVSQALSARPEARFHSASEMAATIAELLPVDVRVMYAALEEGGSIALRPRAATARSYTTASWLRARGRPRNWPLRISVLMLVIGLAFAGLATSRHFHRDTAPPAADTKDVLPEPKALTSSGTEPLAPMPTPSAAPTAVAPPATPSVRAPNPRPAARAPTPTTRLAPTSSNPKSDSRDRM